MSEELNLNLENTSWERIDGEIIVISYNTGKYYSVNKQGSDLLHLIEMKVKKEFWYEILKSNFRNFEARWPILCSDSRSPFLLRSLHDPIDYHRCGCCSPSQTNRSYRRIIT